MVQPFLNSELKDRELKAFLAHVKSCKSCWEELETYFIVDYALKYLDNEKNNSYDMKALLNTLISQEEHDLQIRETVRFLMIAAVIVLAALVILAALGVPVPEPVREIGMKFRQVLTVIRSQL